MNYFSGWDMGFLPPLVWRLTADPERSFYALQIIAGVAFFYLILCLVLGLKKEQINRRITSTLGVAFCLLTFLLLFKTADTRIGPQLAPLSLIAVLFALQLVLMILVFGGWLTKIRSAQHRKGFLDYCRVRYWYIQLNLSYIFIPLVLFSVEIIHTTNKTIYLGSLFIVVFSTFLLLRGISRQSEHMCGIEKPREKASAEAQIKYAKVIKILEELGFTEVRILRRGLSNALACVVTRRIYISEELLEKLSVEELKGVLLHELGHIHDRKYIPMKMKLIVCAAFAYLFHQLFMQMDIVSPIIELVLLFLGIFIFFRLFLWVKLRAEFYADSFVKQHSEDAYTHFLAAIEKIQQLNGVEKDYCKKSNVAHLDLDERQKMVEEGEFKPRRKTGFKSLIRSVITILLVFGIAYSLTFLPSNKVVWRELQGEYQTLYKEKNYSEAHEKIQQAYEHAQMYYGPVHFRVYRSLNDLTQVSLARENREEALKYAEQALALGDKLYAGKNKLQLRSLRFLEQIYAEQSLPDELQRVYTRIFEVQKNSGVSPAEQGTTLRELFQKHLELNDGINVERTLKELLQLYRDQSDMEGEGLKLFDMFDILYTEKKSFKKNIRSDFIRDLERITLQKYGEHSLEYASFFAEKGFYLDGRQQFKEAQKAYHLCIEKFTSLELEENHDFAGCLYGAGVIAQQEKEYEDAYSLFQRSMELEKKLDGDETINIKHQAKRLGDICVFLEKEEEAASYYRLALKLEEKDPERDVMRLLSCCEALLEILDTNRDKDEINVLEDKVVELHKESTIES